MAIQLNQYVFSDVSQAAPILKNAAGTLITNLNSDSSTLNVCEDSDDLRQLTPGYYLRFVKGPNYGDFHLYGIEVMHTGEIWVHENCPDAKISNKHWDSHFYHQLLDLDKQGRVIYRQAVQQGGGIELHSALCQIFLDMGHVGKEFTPPGCILIKAKNAAEREDALGSSSDLDVSSSTTLLSSKQRAEASEEAYLNPQDEGAKKLKKQTHNHPDTARFTTSDSRINQLIKNLGMKIIALNKNSDELSRSKAVILNNLKATLEDSGEDDILYLTVERWKKANDAGWRKLAEHSYQGCFSFFNRCRTTGSINIIQEGVKNLGKSQNR